MQNLWIPVIRGWKAGGRSFSKVQAAALFVCYLWWHLKAWHHNSAAGNLGGHESNWNGESSGTGCFIFVDALPQLELLEIILGANHSLASDYGSFNEPYGMSMESGEPYVEPLLLDAAVSGTMHLVYHHCPYTDAILQGWRFQGNQFVVREASETPLLFQRRAKMCVARRIEIRSDGEQEGSELTLTAGEHQEPRFFGYRLDDKGYTAYFVAFTRMVPSRCFSVKCCKANSSLPCQYVFYDVRKPEKKSLFQQVVGATSAPLSRECPLCIHDGGEDGVPLDYFTAIEDGVLSADCPNLKPHTYGDSFVFLGPGKSGSRVHKHYAIGSLSNTLQLRNFGKMTQVSVQYPNNLWLSRAGAYHQDFNPPEAERTYYIVRGAEYTTVDIPAKRLQEVVLFYDSLANAYENKGTQFISDLKKRAMAESKTADAIFAEHPIANDMAYFHSSPIGDTFRFVAGGSFKLPSSKFVTPAVIKGFCVSPLFYDQWAVFLVIEEPSPSSMSSRVEAIASRHHTRTTEWTSSPLPWWDDTPLAGYSSARRGQVLYMQVPIFGSRSYNERTLRVFNASTHGSFHCSAAGSSSVVLLYHDAVNHILHLEERFRDGTVLGDSQIELRRVLHGSLLPTRTVTSLEKGPDSVLWLSSLTTKRFSAEESFYYVPGEKPGRVVSIQRATGFHRDGDCIGEWAPALSSAVCTEFCVSLHAYRVKVPPRGGSGCSIEEGAELSRMCLASPCSRGRLATVQLNSNSTAKRPQTAEAQMSTSPDARTFKDAEDPEELSAHFKDKTANELAESLDWQEPSSGSSSPNMRIQAADLTVWQDGALDKSLEVPPEADGTASATIDLEAALDLWHLRITFSSFAVQSGIPSEGFASFEFSVSLVDDDGEEIHTWQTVVPPSPASQSVWEALDMRVHRVKQIVIKALQPFRVAEIQAFGMPLPACPPGGFLGPSECSRQSLQRLHSFQSLDCQGAWSEWTVCQVDCRRKSCKSAEGCDISPTYFPAPPDQPGAAEDDILKEIELMRPIGGLFLVGAVALVFVLLALVEAWRRWGTSMNAHQEVLNVQRQRDLYAAREQILRYRQMIQDYKTKLDDEEQGSLMLGIPKEKSPSKALPTEEPLGILGYEKSCSSGAESKVFNSVLPFEALRGSVMVELGGLKKDEGNEAQENEARGLA
ncbi:hypothetical protein Emed_007447 [Eimeria media]